MPDNELKIGDVVRLKSGSPAMTIDSFAPEKVGCIWFVGTEQKGGYFAHDALEHTDADTSW